MCWIMAEEPIVWWAFVEDYRVMLCEDSYFAVVSWYHPIMAPVHKVLGTIKVGYH